MSNAAQEQILEDVQKMVAMLKDQKYHGPYAFSFDGRVWHEVKEEDGKVVLNHRPKKRKSRNRLKKLAKAYQR